MSLLTKNLLEDTIRTANAAGRIARIPFLPFRYPSAEGFWEQITALDECGADIIEVGVPFSDPVADGPVIEAASQQCLTCGATLHELLCELKARRASLKAGIVLMGYANPFYRFGFDQFAKQAAEAGVNGVIIPDMPLEEAGEIRELLAARGVDLIALIGLNTSRERMQAYAEHASGFVYMVSVLGTTGGHTSLDDVTTIINEKLDLARSVFSIPLALGFGISRPEQLEPFGDRVDAAIFGSALVSHVGEGRSSREFMDAWK